MTPEERRKQHIINGRPSQRRIAKGSGTSVGGVNRLLKQFVQMQKKCSSRSAEWAGFCRAAAAKARPRRRGHADAAGTVVRTVVRLLARNRFCNVAETAGAPQGAGPREEAAGGGVGAPQAGPSRGCGAEGPT